MATASYTTPWDMISPRGNVYFNPNSPAGETSPHKLNKGHIGELRAVWADLDPLDRLEVLPSDDPDNPAMNGRAKEKLRLLELAEAVRESDFPPTLAIDSGNGVQLLWALDDHVECSDGNREKAEKLGHRIEAALGGTENTARRLSTLTTGRRATATQPSGGTSSTKPASGGETSANSRSRGFAMSGAISASTARPARQEAPKGSLSLTRASPQRMRTGTRTRSYSAHREASSTSERAKCVVDRRGRRTPSEG